MGEERPMRRHTLIVGRAGWLAECDRPARPARHGPFPIDPPKSIVWHSE